MKAFNNFFTLTVVIILVGILIYLGSSFFIMEKGVVIKIIKKSSAVVKNSTEYYLNDGNEDFSLRTNSLAISTDDMRIYEQIIPGSCQKVDIQGYKSSFLPRGITSISEVPCQTEAAVK